MNSRAMMILLLGLLPWYAGSGCTRDGTRRSSETSEQKTPQETTAAASPDTATTARGSAADSEAARFMPMMWMHLDSMARSSPEQMQRMMATHQQMAGQMMQMMGSRGMMGHGMGMAPGTPWTALRDSIQDDLSAMPRLSGKELAARSRAHIERMRRMMVLGMGMMPNGGWAMSGGCGMLDSAGSLSAQQRQRMWAMHRQMSDQMMNAMMANMRARGAAPSPEWKALRDSVTRDMTEMPKLQGDSLRSLMQKHADRMHRLMALQGQAWGMPMSRMGMGGCPR